MNTPIKISAIEKRWFTTKDAMDYLGKSRRWFERMRTDAKLSFYKVGGTVFYAKRDLDRIIERNRII